MSAMKRTKRWIGAVAIAATLASGCSSTDSLELVTDAGEAATTGQSRTASIADDSEPIEITTTIPGGRVAAPERPAGAIVMGQANWSSGWVHPQIIHDLLEEMGYAVTTPSEREFAPDQAYQSMATGQIDFWANSWYPGHLSWWDGELQANAGQVRDHLTRPETPMVADGGLQGWLVSKAWAEANRVTTIDQINADESLWRQLDSDGNGKGEFYGCPEDWTCDDIMRSMSTFAQWDRLEQVKRDYDSMFDEFLTHVEAGEPAIIYTWAPTNYLARAKLGENTMWISVLDDSVVDDSNPLQIDLGPPGWDCQRCDGVIGFKGLDPSVCLHGPDGCQLGWNAASIEITANSAWLTKFPDIEALFEQISFSANELSQLLLLAEQAGGNDEAVRAVAAGWIDANRDEVDDWLRAATGAD